MSVVALRRVKAADLDAIYQQMRDPESVRMAAFTPEDPSDRSAFDAHMEKVMSSAEGTLRAITHDDRLVGTIASFVSNGVTEVTYWIDRASWGQGIASQALAQFLDVVPVRPLRAAPRATTLARCGSFRRQDSTYLAPRCRSLPAAVRRSRRRSSSCPESELQVHGSGVLVRWLLDNDLASKQGRTV